MPTRHATNSKVFRWQDLAFLISFLLSFFSTGQFLSRRGKLNGKKSFFFRSSFNQGPEGSEQIYINLLHDRQVLVINAGAPSRLDFFFFTLVRCSLRWFFNRAIHKASRDKSHWTSDRSWATVPTLRVIPASNTFPIFERFYPILANKIF